MGVDTWIGIFKMPFRTRRETKIYFQYKIMHHTIPSNKWMFNIKMKS